jgi:hypothetical protein
MLPSRDQELDDFKTKIDLRNYALSVGFEYVRRQSSAHSSVLKHANGDKIVVARMPWKHYVYFNVHAGSGDDSGSIIDFVQSRGAASLGQVRKTLRTWSGTSSFEPSRPTPLLPTLEPSSQDSARVFAAWTKANSLAENNNYLNAERAIPSATTLHDVFQGRIRVDGRRNILFAHYNKSGLCGYEAKNRGFTGFAPGGVKGLFYSSPQPSDHTMVICETAIDLLSVAALGGVSGRRFFSMAGQPSQAQIELLQSAAVKMPTRPTALIAVDNDEAGQRMAALLQSALAASCDEIVNHLPPTPGQDWNDVLRDTRTSASPQVSIG